MYFSERILWHMSKAVQCWLVLEWFHFVICHLYGIIRTIIKSFLYTYTYQYLYTCIVIVCEHELRIVICCALSNKELLLLLQLVILCFLLLIICWFQFFRTFYYIFYNTAAHISHVCLLNVLLLRFVVFMFFVRWLMVYVLFIKNQLFH